VKSFLYKFNVKNTTESKETNIVVKFPKMKLYDMTEETGDISYIY